ncbi:hypothetical protein FKM82_028671 [Ascaphus truei]
MLELPIHTASHSCTAVPPATSLHTAVTATQPCSKHPIDTQLSLHLHLSLRGILCYFSRDTTAMSCSIPLHACTARTHTHTHTHTHTQLFLYPFAHNSVTTPLAG